MQALRIIARGGITCAALLTALGCDQVKNATSHDAGVTEPSPNASILPAPLSSVPEPVGVDSLKDAGRKAVDAGSAEGLAPEPRWLREDQALTGETLHEASGVTLIARFRWPDLDAPVRTPELNPESVQRVRDAVAFDVVIDLASGHMRFALASRAFTLPAGTEFHARDDLYGYALLWPNRMNYTVIAAGALRSVLQEDRADVVPLVRVRASAPVRGSLLGLATTRVELSTPNGKLELEQAHVQTLPSGTPASSPWPSGASLCHLLLELVGASPANSLCRSELLPLRATYTWPNGRRFMFEVARYTRHPDFNPVGLATPPAGAEFRQSELPPPPPSMLLSEGELGELRVRPLPRTDKLEPNAPKSGLLAVNHSDGLRYICVDGARTLRLAPGAEELVLGLRAGKYQISARDFFDAEEPVIKTLELPARFSLGDEPEKNH